MIARFVCDMYNIRLLRNQLDKYEVFYVNMQLDELCIYLSKILYFPLRASYGRETISLVISRRNIRKDYR